MPSSTRPAPCAPRSGFSLLELVMVVVILALLATLAVPRLGGVLRNAKENAAEADMEALRTAFLGDEGATHGLVGDLEGIPGFSRAYLRIANLVTPACLVGVADNWLDDDPGGHGYAGIDDSDRRDGDAGFAVLRGAVNLTTFAEFATFTNRDEIAQRGWRGPYLAHARIGEFPGPDHRRFANDHTAAERGFFPRWTGGRTFRVENPVQWTNRIDRAYGISGEPAVLDPWGNPYVLQVPPAEAWANANEISEPDRFRYARIVSAGPDGELQTPCFGTITADDRRDCRLAGRRKSSRDTATLRGDDIVLFLLRADTYEDEEK